MLILTQFVLRLSFGLAFAMGVTSPRKVTSGYFRNHSYVLLGLNVIALLAALARPGPIYEHPSAIGIRYETPPAQSPAHLSVWPPLIGAILCYACAATWLYEKSTLGRVLLFAIAAVSLIGVWVAQPMPFFPGEHEAPIPWANISLYVTTVAAPFDTPLIYWRISALFSGLLLGSTIAAMFLGHWYLNTPTMELKPLRELIQWMALATFAQAVLSGLALFIEWRLSIEWQLSGVTSSQCALLALRWLGGIFGAAILTWMTWRTLKIPNTQSATGILYVAVVATFLGELTSLLLSGSTGFPL